MITAAYLLKITEIAIRAEKLISVLFLNPIRVYQICSKCPASLDAGKKTKWLLLLKELLILCNIGIIKLLAGTKHKNDFSQKRCGWREILNSTGQKDQLQANQYLTNFEKHLTINYFFRTQSFQKSVLKT